MRRAPIFSPILFLRVFILIGALGAVADLAVGRTRFVFAPESAAQFAADGAGIQTVTVAGTFNGWNNAKDPMSRGDDGSYVLELDLPAGLHHYKFVVNGTHWLTDPSAPADLDEPDGHGGHNSGIFVGERGSDYGPAEPIRILSKAIKHDPGNLDDFNVFSPTQAAVRIRVRENDVAGLILIHRVPGVPVRRLPMTRLFSRFEFDYYSVDIPLDAGQKKIEYLFELADKSALLYFTPAPNPAVSRIDQTTPWFRRDARMEFPVPEWAKHVVWYQIMPDRWRNGDQANDPNRTVPWQWDWFKPFTPGEEKKFYGGDGIWNRFFGGDIAGLMQSLDYLDSLGVTGIYLNPAFEATSYHKYNAADYRHIDDNFGTKGDVRKAWPQESSDSATWTFTPTDSLFLTFLDQAHQRGFKVILDGVFNHSGTDFWAFKDLVKDTIASPYRDWYVVRKWDVPPAGPGDPTFSYDGWAGFSGLPEFAENEEGLLPGIRNHIFDITRRWQDPNGDGNPADGVDGWRLDVPENVNERFWVDWRKLVKGVNPNAYITGEIWENAAHRLRGRHYDAVMNYEFTKRLYGFFLPGGKTAAVSAPEFARSLEDLQNSYLPQVNFVLQNLLGSHDADRIASAIHNRAGWKQGRIQDDNPKYDPSPPGPESYEVLKRVVVLQMTWIGAPMIYYGDEAGMYGADDPTNRMPMWWPDLMPYDNPSYQIRQDLLDHHRRMIAIRNTYPALRTGRARILFTDDSTRTVAFERHGGRSRVIVVVRDGTDTRPVMIPLETTRAWVDVADPANAVFAKGYVEGIGSMRTVIKVAPSARRIRPVKGKLTVDLTLQPWAVLVEGH